MNGVGSMALTSIQREALQEAAEAYAGQMTARAVDYLRARGFTKEIAVGNLLGEVCEPLPGHDQFIGRLSIPYVTPAGVVGIKFRALGEEQPKYMGISGQHSRLYNARAFHLDSADIAIVEGELDALVMTELVGVPAVAVPGAPIWLQHWPRCFSDYDRVFVVCDNDASNDQNPGQRLAKKIAEDLRGAVVVTPPPDMDINSWYLAEGAGAIREKMGVA